MKFLINESFLKTVPKELKDVVQNKLFKFYEILSKTNLYKLPNSFWIKKINYKSKEFYEFRVNSGDRIIFDLITNNLKKTLRFCYFSNHDRALEKYKKMQLNNFSNFEILKEDYPKTEIKDYTLEYEKIFNNIHLIDYKIENEEFFKNLIDNKESSLYYCLYLNKEQYNCLNYESPLIINGGAGSGKTAILFNKMLNLLSENKLSKDSKINLGYFCLNIKLKENIEEIMKQVIGKNTDIKFYSVTEYLLDNLGTNENNLITYKNFQSFFSAYSKKVFKGKKSEIKVEQAYSEINGIIKGMMFNQSPDNWKRNLTNELITLDEYQSLPEEYSIYDSTKRNDIYKIAIAYQNYLKTNKKLDLNDLSRIMIDNISEDKKLDYIFIDEVQDLTEVQIFMINSLCKDFNNVFFAGDIHQVVTMNHFNVNRLSQLHNKNGKNIKFLVKNYRSRQKIIEVSNKVKELRKKYIGSQKMEYEQLEEHISEGGKFNIEKVNIHLLEKVSLDADFIILVSNDKQKIELLKLLKLKDNFLDMIFTVEEAKGLEFESVICYNLISSNLNEWDIILSNNAKKNQNYRYFFNLLYVGITRAKSNIIFMEEEVENNPLLKEFQEILTATQVSDSIKVSSSEEWKKRANELEKFGKIKEAEYSRKKSLQINTEKPKIYNTKNSDSFFDSLVKNNYHKTRKFLQNGFNPNYVFVKFKFTIPLIFASQNGHIEIVKLLLEYGADTNIQTDTGATALGFASQNGHIEIVKLLLEYGADTNIQTDTGATALGFALQNGHIEIVKLLLEYGAQTNIQANGGVTALICASTMRQIETVKLLLEHGANVNIQTNGGVTALGSASQNGHIEIVKLLLEHGANVNIQANDGVTALGSASQNGHIKIVKLLLEHGANANDGVTALIWASKEGHIEIVKLLLEHGANVNIQVNDGVTALMLASEVGHIEIVKLLLEHGANVNIQANDGVTTLMLASEAGHIEIVKFLLEHGANVNIQANDGVTALGSASKEGHIEIVKLLLEHGIDANIQTDTGATALMLALIKGHIETVKLLLEHGANVNIQENYGVTTLMLASEAGHIEIVKFLLEHGANVNIQANDGVTALGLASKEGHIEIVKLLLEHGIDANIQAENGTTALMFALIKGHIETVKFLLENGADVNIQGKNGATALMLALGTHHMEIVKLLLENGADVNIQGKNGEIALMFALIEGHIEIVKLLLERGIDANIQGNNGEIPLTVASQKGYIEIIKLLLEYNADINIQSENGATALIRASENGHIEIVKLLLERGAQTNIQSKNGATALMLASQNGYIKIVKFLLEYGAQANIRTNDGVTALILALKEGHIEIIKFLLEHGTYLNVQDKNGIISSMYQSTQGNTEILKLISEYESLN
ncbi:ankyrin repeat domain-containing protein [Cetobacterium sp.]|uniref:ankyrin repeat domain-containing protein n=1 Tax=Cetobacterium sp. TaxID=2071632 RepID=UPI003F353939